MKRLRDTVPEFSHGGKAGPVPIEDPVGATWGTDQMTEPASGETDEGSPIQYEKYRKLTRQHLQKLRAQFTKFDGVSSHLVWESAQPELRRQTEALKHSRLCRQVALGRAASAMCRRCAARHLVSAARSGPKGHFFTCPLGVQNFCRPIIVRNRVVALSFLQTLAFREDGSVDGPKRLRAPRRTACSVKGWTCPRPGDAEMRTRRSRFRQAARLLGLLLRHVEMSVLADLRESDLTRTRRALLEFRTRTARLQAELNHRVPEINARAAAFQPACHAEQVARAMLECVHRRYAQPLTLRECACELRMNAAYLSDLFSRTVGLPFKTYLTELRMQKAKELLANPALNLSEVADSVGYTSENRFRIAFKKMTGLSPRLWRETFHVNVESPSLPAAC